jgi:hypothetical protein
LGEGKAMNREDIQKLLGGYATGTLTPEEQQVLFDAAIEDQEIFDLIAKEQPLHDLLGDPAARAELLAALDRPHLRWWQRWQVQAGAAVALAGLVTGVIVMRRPSPGPILTAEFKAPPAVPQPLSENRTPVPAATPGESLRSIPATRHVEPRTSGSGSSALARKADQPEELRAKKESDAEQLPKVATEPPPPPVRAASPPIAPPVSGRQMEQQVQVLASQSPAPSQQTQQAQDALAPGAPPQSAANFQNARSLFYGTQLTDALKDQSANQLSESSQDKQKAAAPKSARAVGVTTGALAGATKMFSSPPAANLGVRIEVLRRLPGGAFTSADPENLNGNDTVKLRLTPNDDGFLTVLENVNVKGGATGPVKSGPALRMVPFEVDVPPPGRSETREFVVQFTRQAGIGGVGGYLNPADQRRLDQASFTDRDEKATYVASKTANPTAQQIVQPITLRYK